MRYLVAVRRSLPVWLGAVCFLAALTAVETSADAVDPGQGATTSVKKKAADYAFRNGVIYTVTSRKPKAALAVRNGRIVYVGKKKGLKPFIGSKTRVINLRGRMVMPGLEDHHNHALSGGREILSCTLGYKGLTKAEFLAEIQGCLDATSDHEPDGWLSVESWNVQAMKPEGYTPTAQELDTLKTTRPIIVNGSDGHAALANSRALSLAGIDKDTPDPPDGRILRGPGGEPTGIVSDGAQSLIRKHVPDPTPEDNVAALKAAIGALNAQGVTSIWTPDRGRATAEAATTVRGQGELDIRMNLGYWADAELTAEQNLAAAEKMRAEFADSKVGVRPGITLKVMKIAADGINQYPAQTGALLTPYRTNIGTPKNPLWVPGTDFGELYWPAPTMYPLVKAFDAAGWQSHIHCVGDRCTRTALDAYEYARRVNGKSDNRHVIVHIDLCHPRDYKRFKKLGVIASMSFQWAQRDGFFLDATRNYLGDKRWKRQFPGGSLYRNGATIAAGSDWPVDPLNEWLAMELAVTRTGPLPGKYSKPLNKREGIPLRAAIRANTLNSAYQLHQDKVTGSLDKGKFADLIVLNRNILKGSVKRVSDTKVDLTMVGGKVVYKR